MILIVSSALTLFARRLLRSISQFFLETADAFLIHFGLKKQVPKPDPEAFHFLPAEDAMPNGTADDRYGNSVLVGTLRTNEQLQYSMRTNRYYAPSRFLTVDPSSLRYIALHEEGIGTEPGIRKYGEIISLQSLPRRTIEVAMRPETDPGELYHEFTVKEWLPLPHPILLCDTFRGRPRFTSLFLLLHCTRSYQLFEIRSEEDRRLMQLLNRAMEAMRFADDPGQRGDYPYGSGLLLVLGKGHMTLKRSAGTIVEQFRLDWLLRHPRAGFVRLKRALLEEAKNQPQ